MQHRRPALAGLCLLVLTLVQPVHAQESLEEARERREQLQAEAAQTASQLDVLEAEDAEILDALADIESYIAIQEANLESATLQLAAAEDAATEARQRADALDAEIDDLRAVVAQQSVNAYVGGFSNDDSLLLNTEDINSVPVLRFLLDETTGVSEFTVDQLRAAVARQADAVAEAEAASDQARQLSADIETEIETLAQNRAAQQALSDEVASRIAELEETADVLAAEDAEIEQFIQAELQRIAEEEAARKRAEEEAQRQAEEEAARIAAEQEEAERAEAEAEAEEAARQEAEAAAEEEAAAAEDEAPADAEESASDESDAEAEAAEATDEESGEEPTAEPEPTPAPPLGDDVPNFVRPVPGAISSGFGNRVHPVYGTTRMHTGLDFNAPSGTSIGSAAAGEVIFVGPFAGYGNTVIVQHSGGYSSLYAHMSGFNTSVGARVEPGETIGFVGSTGLSTGPHLHFEIRLNGGAIDPAPFM